MNYILAEPPGYKTLPLKKTLIYALALVIFSLSASAAEDKEHDAFRVCADPDYLPFSDRDTHGFENKLADLLAADLNLPVEYTWFPQRLGFIRNTLKAEDPEHGRYKCNVVMGVPQGYELVITTEPYYRSTYALVYVKGRGLDDVDNVSDLIEINERKPLHIGVSERSPGALWLAKHDMYKQIVAYIAQSGDPDVSPGELEGKDLADGKIDAVILWGPVASFVTQQLNEQGLMAQMIPMISEPGVRFDYAISAGVRFGDSEWKKVINEQLQKNKSKIQDLLNTYNIPLVKEDGSLVTSTEESK